MDIIGSVGHRRAELPIRNPPMEVMVMEEEDTCELTSGVEVGPVNSGATSVVGVEDEGVEGRVKRG